MPKTDFPLTFMPISPKRVMEVQNGNIHSDQNKQKLINTV